MALSDGEKYDVIRYLGWPAKTIQAGSLDYNTVIVSRLNNLHAEVEEDIRDMLERIETMDEKREKAMSRAGVKQIGDIILNNDEFSLLKGERKRIIKELAALLGIAMPCGGGNNIPVCI